MGEDLRAEILSIKHLRKFSQSVGVYKRAESIKKNLRTVTVVGDKVSCKLCFSRFNGSLVIR